MDPLKNNKFNLDDLKKQNPFQVPEHYFDSLGTRISDRIEASAPRERELVPVFARIKPILAFSGGFAGLAVVVYLSFSLFFNKDNERNVVANNELASLNEYAIVSTLDEGLLIEEFSETTAVTTDSLHQENQDNIIDYLVKEDIDISTIIEEL